jgi:hypothetical protein
MRPPSHAVVAIDMGYGHLRPAYAVAEALGTDVLQVDQAPLARDEDQRLWAYVRQYYENLSRASQWPVFGLPLRTLLAQVTGIRDLYSERDQSRPNVAAKVLDRVIKKGLGSTLVEYLDRRDATLVTTFFMPAIAADRLGYDKIFCIVTDSDIHRVWAPMDPGNTRINYLVPSQRTRRRLRAYGVPESRIRVTGFPLPHRLVGGTELRDLKQNLGRRLVRLDPSGNFRKDLKHAISHFLGPLPDLAGRDTVPVLTFAVGGAGAQVGLADRFLPGLRSLLDERRLELVLVAGIRTEVAEQLRECVRRAGLARQLEAGGSIRIVYEADFPTYLDTFNDVLAQTDVLWTKPSEMTFFAGLGLPLVFSEPVGTHEQYNRRWAREEGAGLKQRDPRFAGEWLKDWLKDGTLAAAAWNGFTRMPSHGLYQILDALDVEESAEGVARISNIRDSVAVSGMK